jgi:hypothetical protein
LNLSQKLWIRVHGKAQGESKAESRPWRDELFILIRSGTPPWALRRIFEMGSNNSSNKGVLHEKNLLNHSGIRNIYGLCG